MNSASFGKAWALIPMTAMDKSGHGKRFNAVKHSGIGEDRREDKLDGSSALARRYAKRYSTGVS
jgi:hypothetical protein